LPENLAGLGDPTHHIENETDNKHYFQRPPCIERWLRNKAPLPRKRYPNYLNRFQLLTGLTPEQFLAWCKTVESIEVQDLIDKTSIEFKPAIQFCYRVAIRSFLRHNGYNSLPKTDLQYVSQQWHRGYRRGEIEKLLAFLRQKIHRLFVVMAAESGLRSNILMQLRYSHIIEDLESGTIPLAVRLEPRFYVGKKAAGYTFFGDGSIHLIREYLTEGLIQRKPECTLIARSYWSVWAAINRARRKIGLDSKIRPCHGFRKYFENAPDIASIDHEKKIIIEGHLAGTRAKHYTDRDVEELRDIYRRVYPFIRLDIDEPVQIRTDNESYNRKFADLEARVDRQRVLEAKLTVLEDELDQMKQFRKRLEQQGEG
jgi:integrase